MQKIEKTANKDRQFFKQGEKVKVFYYAPVSPNGMGIHLLLTSWSTISSDAILPVLLKNTVGSAIEGAFSMV